MADEKIASHTASVVPQRLLPAQTRPLILQHTDLSVHKIVNAMSLFH